MAETNVTLEEKDTVAGRLASFNNFTNPLARQTASVASRIGASRRMSNSSVTVGEGLGAVLAQSVDIAKTDSSNIINTKNQNAVNNTNIRNTDANNTSSEKVATLQSETQKQIQQAEAQARRQDLASQLEVQERIAAADRLSRSSDLAKELSYRTQTDSANRQVQREQTAANTAVAQSEILSRERQAQFQRDNEVLITNLNNSNQMKIEEMRARYQQAEGQRNEMGAAWSQYQAGLASIDPNASSASQNEMFSRITTAFEARMDFIKSSTPYAPAPSTQPSASYSPPAQSSAPAVPAPPAAPAASNTAQSTFLNTLNNVSTTLAGTGGQSGQSAATAAALVAHGKAAGYSEAEIAAAAANVFKGSSYGDLLGLVSKLY